MNDRKHLSGREFERLLEAVKGSRNETRDRCLVLLIQDYLGHRNIQHTLRHTATHRHKSGTV
jgi:integrase